MSRFSRWMMWIAIVLACVGSWEVAAAGWIHAKAILAQGLIASAWTDARHGGPARR
ncbi:MAG: class GN sortase, partial [Burkholderiales bacterium]|nr:class GN sortase [Burkholderiales bacterium]